MSVWLSATQIDNFRRCPRYWAWQKIAGLETPPNKSLELGKRVHDILDAFYSGKGAPQLDETYRFDRKSALFYPGKIAAQMIDNEWARRIAAIQSAGRLKSEVSFEDRELGADYGVVFTGRADLHFTFADTLSIIDHKTSSDPEKWGKKDLEHDTQRMLYLAALSLWYPKAAELSFALNYGSTKLQRRKNYVIEHTSTRSLLMEQFIEEIEPVARAMAELKRRKTNPLKIEPDASACGLFGGCPFIDNCALTQKQKMKGLIMGNALLDQILKNRPDLRKQAEELGVSPGTEDPMNPPEAASETSEAPTTKAEPEKVDPPATKAEPEKVDPPATEAEKDTSKPPKARRAGARKPKEATPEASQSRDDRADLRVVRDALCILAGSIMHLDNATLRDAFENALDALDRVMG